MLTGVVHTALQACDRSEYFTVGSCPSCGGILSGYDSRTRQFVVLRDDEQDHPVTVILHRAYCRSCGRICVPDEPFYPGTRVGSPVVDLCRVLAETMSCGRVATRLNQMGIVIDRWSVRSYVKKQLPPVRVVTAFGMRIPVTVISLSGLAGSHIHSGHTGGEDVLAACNYPSRSLPGP